VRAIDVEELAWQWRVALEAASSANRAAAAAMHGSFSPRHVTQLAAERKLVVRDLAAIAAVHRVAVDVRHLAIATTNIQRLLGLPSDVTACVFNLDGVLLPSAALHAAAWREAFDEFVLARTERTRGVFEPFDLHGDYYAHIHGKPRLDGVRALLASRGIRLPEGSPADPAGTETVHGLAARKKEALLRRLALDHLRAFEGARHYLELAREAGLHRVAVSASANARQMLIRADLAPLVEECVDGTTMLAEHLSAKPAPDTLVAACSAVATDPGHAVAFETTSDGVAAARRAGFELVVGIDTGETAAELRLGGADRVVSGLAELLEQQVAA
jgi:beta-phosphoglucomutase-like phosphatase (HAD superfamily)